MILASWFYLVHLWQEVLSLDFDVTVIDSVKRGKKPHGKVAPYAPVINFFFPFLNPHPLHVPPNQKAPSGKIIV